MSEKKQKIIYLSVAFAPILLMLVYAAVYLGQIFSHGYANNPWFRVGDYLLCHFIPIFIVLGLTIGSLMVKKERARAFLIGFKCLAIVLGALYCGMLMFGMEMVIIWVFFFGLVMVVLNIISVLLELQYFGYIEV